MRQSPRDNIFKTHCGCFYHFLFILMQSLKLIPSPRNELTDSVASVQFKDDRLSVGMWSPKSSLQLKLKQALSKSAKISETDQGFEELSKAYEESLRVIAQKQGQLVYYRAKTDTLLKKTEFYEGLLENFTEALTKLVKSIGCSSASNVSFSVDGLLDCSAEIKDYEENIFRLFQQLEDYMFQLLEERKEEDREQIYGLIDHHGLEGKHQTGQMRNQIQKLTSRINQLESDILGKDIELERYKKEEQDFDEMSKAVDLKIKNRAELIILLKGIAKKYRRHEKQCRMDSPLAPLDPHQLEDYITKKTRQISNKKSSIERVLNFA